MISITGLFKPVSIDGTQVSRAYLHNLDIFESFEFGLGDKIRIYKANTIIPQIAENVTKSKTYNLPESCPCCSNKLTVKITSGGTPVNYSARIPIVQLSWFRSLYIFVRRPE
jgi:DNA ligase (NAD+)